jgi:hypothetical protein
MSRKKMGFLHNKDRFSSFYTQIMNSMDKQLHSFLLTDQHSNPFPAPHHTLQTFNMEEEFSSELALLQSYKLNPRPEATANLLQMIQSTVAEQQH